MGGMIRLIMEVPALRVYFDFNTVERDVRADRCVPTGRVKTLDEFLNFPHLNILFRLILTHFFSSLDEYTSPWNLDRGV